MPEERDRKPLPCQIVLFSKKFHPQYLRDHPEDEDLIPDDIPYDIQITNLEERKIELLEEIQDIEERIEKIKALQANS